MEAAIPKARTVREEVESKCSEVAKRANASASGMVDNITGKMREVAAYTDAQTFRAVGDLQSKMRDFVEGHCRNLKAKIEQNQVEAQHAAQETKAAVDNLSTQLAQLTTWLADFQPARSADVGMG